MNVTCVKYEKIIGDFFRKSFMCLCVVVRSVEHFFFDGKLEFYLKQTKFIQHQHLGLWHITEIPLG